MPPETYNFVLWRFNFRFEDKKMVELQIGKKLNDRYRRNCIVCEDTKHVSKFRRYNGINPRICNECFLTKRSTKNVNN